MDGWILALLRRFLAVDQHGDGNNAWILLGGKKSPPDSTVVYDDHSVVDSQYCLLQVQPACMQPMIERVYPISLLSFYTSVSVIATA